MLCKLIVLYLKGRQNRPACPQIQISSYLQICDPESIYLVLQTPFTDAAARAREHAAEDGRPLLFGKAVHIIKSGGVISSSDGSAAALTRMALAHGAKVRNSQLCLMCTFLRKLALSKGIASAGWEGYAHHREHRRKA